jgi:hypothetical protein
MLAEGGMMDGWTRGLLEQFFADPDVPEEEKQKQAHLLNQAYGPNPTPEQAEAVRNWCPMGD